MQTNRHHGLAAVFRPMVGLYAEQLHTLQRIQIQYLCPLLYQSESERWSPTKVRMNRDDSQTAG